MTPFPVKPYMLLLLAETVLLTIVYLGLMYFRFNQFGPETFSGCFELGLDNEQLQICMYEVMAFYMNSSTWMAIQYTLLVIPAILLAWRLTRGRTNAVLVAATAGLSTALIIWLIVTPPLLPTLAALTGIPLGGLLASSRFSSA